MGLWLQGLRLLLLLAVFWLHSGHADAAGLVDSVSVFR